MLYPPFGDTGVTRRGWGAQMDWGVLIIVGIAVWCAAAVTVALLLGRVIRNRERQTPTRPVDGAKPSEEDKAA